MIEEADKSSEGILRSVDGHLIGVEMKCEYGSNKQSEPTYRYDVGEIQYFNTTAPTFRSFRVITYGKIYPLV